MEARGQERFVACGATGVLGRSITGDPSSLANVRFAPWCLDPACPPVPERDEGTAAAAAG
ncbi:MAG: hypothetical protein LC624_04335 [Halobacteriales archaeon]|nr:hypothetical protein [Halobacteriales archaeon]